MEWQAYFIVLSWVTLTLASSLHPLQTQYLELQYGTFGDRALSAGPQTQSLYWVQETSRLLLEFLWFQLSFFNPILFQPPNVLVNEFEYDVLLGLPWWWLPSVCMSVAMQLFFPLSNKKLGCYVLTLDGKQYVNIYLWIFMVKAVSLSGVWYFCQCSRQMYETFPSQFLNAQFTMHCSACHCYL